MFWADQLIQNLDKKTLHRVDDQSTPSGHYHVGSLRAVAIHGIVYEAMKKAGFDVDFTYVFNDMDPMDGLPTYLDEKEYLPHMGKPLFMIPAPDGKSESFAVQYSNEYHQTLKNLGFTPDIKWTSKMYKNGEFDEYIKRALDHADTIRKIYKEVAKQDKPANWYPFQVICPNCKKIGSSLVTDWNGEEVTYECKKDLVTWSVGCGQTGKISPFGGTGKLMWKVEWPAGWAVLNITVEGSGKDHMSQGGSHDIGLRIAPKVFSYNPPFSFMTEFFLVGGAKMSSSKGVGFRAIEIFDIMPAELAKFLIVRVPYKRAINFDLTIPATIPDLFDEYDRCALSYFESGTETDLGRIYEASQIGSIRDGYKPSPTKIYMPRFRQVATLIQMPSVDIYEYFAKQKPVGEGFKPSLTDEEKKLLDERIRFAHIWLDRYADEKDKFHVYKIVPTNAKELEEDQKAYLGRVASLLLEKEYFDGEALQQALFELSKELGVPTKKAFQAIYVALIDKDHGPKAGWLVLDEFRRDKEFIIKRFTDDIRLHPNS